MKGTTHLQGLHVSHALKLKVLAWFKGIPFGKSHLRKGEIFCINWNWEKNIGVRLDVESFLKDAQAKEGLFLKTHYAFSRLREVVLGHFDEVVASVIWFLSWVIGIARISGALMLWILRGSIECNQYHCSFLTCGTKSSYLRTDRMEDRPGRDCTWNEWTVLGSFVPWQKK